MVQELHLQEALRTVGHSTVHVAGVGVRLVGKVGRPLAHALSEHVHTTTSFCGYVFNHEVLGWVKADFFRGARVRQRVVQPALTGVLQCTSLTLCCPRCSARSRCRSWTTSRSWTLTCSRLAR